MELDEGKVLEGNCGDVIALSGNEGEMGKSKEKKHRWGATSEKRKVKSGKKR